LAKLRVSAGAWQVDMPRPLSTAQPASDYHIGSIAVAEAFWIYAPLSISVYSWSTRVRALVSLYPDTWVVPKSHYRNNLDFPDNQKLIDYAVKQA